MDLAIIDVRILAGMVKDTHKRIVTSEIYIFNFFFCFKQQWNSLCLSGICDFVFVMVSLKSPTIWYQKQ